MSVQIPSSISSQDTYPPATKTNTTPTGGGNESGIEESGNGYGSFSDSKPKTGSGSNSESGSEALEANGSWLNGLAMGSGSTRVCLLLQLSLLSFSC